MSLIVYAITHTPTLLNEVKEKYLEFWKHKMANSSKLSFLCTFKKDYKMEKYLTIIKNPNIRKEITPNSKLNAGDTKTFPVINESVNSGVIPVK